MPDLHSIIDDLSQRLDIISIPDYPGAHNGLQLENNGRVSKAAAAVDATLPVIRKAVDQGADLLIVHHGMFWQGAQAIRGTVYERLKLAIDNNLTIFSVHILLDVHPGLGNNALLAKAIGLADAEPFLDWKGISLGLRGPMDIDLDTHIERLTTATGDERIHVCRGGPGSAGTVGIITGGAGSQVQEIAAAGIDTFVSGEGPHWSHTSAEELGINLIHGGHCATETFGVRALAEMVADQCGIEHCFIDHPSGLWESKRKPREIFLK